MISAKESALLALMQDEGYSMGLINTTLHLLRQEREAMDDMLLFIDDYHPTEAEATEHLAELCEKWGLSPHLPHW